LRGDLLVESRRPVVVGQELPVQFARVDREQEVVTADDRPVEVVRDDAVAAVLGVDLRD
jgi:hypothetical protein